VFAAVVLGRDIHGARSKTAHRRLVTAAIKEVAEYLGNTPAVCRSSYIDPWIIDRFHAGETIAGTIHDLERTAASWPELQPEAERTVLDLLSEAVALAA
jgi:DNA topoisomerase IB